MSRKLPPHKRAKSAGVSLPAHQLKLLNQLAKYMRRTRSSLVQQAVDSLLLKYRVQ